MPEINKEDLEKFTSNVNDFFSLSLTEQIDFFAYYLTMQKDLPSVQPKDIKSCFELLYLAPYTNISQYLNKNNSSSKTKNSKYLKTKEGIKLNRNTINHIEERIIKNPIKKKAQKDLNDLIPLIKNTEENDFFSEAINCFHIGAYRATIVLVWNLTLNHLFDYILTHKLIEFNIALSKNTDKRIKISSVSIKDDFSEIPEGKFIEFCRSSGIITNDIRKILDTKLGIRNSYAHPSSLKISESKAIEFIEDLISNVIKKYKI